MDSSELIELFYNRTYEKFVNKQILDDKNYIVPRQQLTNYVHELIDIPYIEFIEYLKQQRNISIVKEINITNYTNFSACEIDMCNALLWANNPGCTFADIGRLFPDNVSSRNDIAYRLYGEKHIKASTQLGLTFEYYDYWYLSCIGYVYPDLNEDERKELLARTITRNYLYRKMLVDIMDHDVYPELYLTMFSESTLKSRIKSVVSFFDICIEECELNNISTHRLYRRNANIDSSSSLSNSKGKTIYSSFYSYELLSFEEMITLFQRYNFRGDLNAFDTLVKSYLRTVLSTAKLYDGKGLEYDDLVQEGTLGLIKAIEKYEYTLGVSFGFYAKTCIKHSIILAINTQSLTVKIPHHHLTIYNKIRKEIEKYEQKNEYIPSITEIEIKEDIELENLSYLNSLPDNLRDLCIPCEDLDVFEDNHNDIWDYEDNEYNDYYVRSLLEHLSKRERDILIRSFGIGVKEETLEHIGDTHGLTRERVRQIREKAIKKLREFTQSSNDKEQDDPEDEDTKGKGLSTVEVERRQHVHKKIKRAGDIISDSSCHHQKKHNRIINKDKKINVLPILYEVKELDGVKVGDRIVYNGKICTICKIIVRDKSSRFLVKYNDEVLDYVPNKKSHYRKVLSQQSISDRNETFVGVAKRHDNNMEDYQHRDKKKTFLSYNGHEFNWNVGDIVKLGLIFTSSIAIQGDPFFLFRKNILFVFMKSRTAKNTALYSKIYLLPTDTQIFKKNYSDKFGGRTPRILFFIYERPTSVQFLDEVKIQEIDTNFIRFESLL